MRIPRVLIGAPASGSGKTTLVCGLLEALSRQGRTPAALKCGPDYIDPMFHRRVTGARSGNLDAYFCDDETLRALLARTATGCGIAVIEGVMGYYDGVGTTEDASSYHVARATQTPVVLAVNARGAALSLAATVAGFAGFRPDANVQGVILNRCSARMADRLAQVIERECGVAVVGAVPTNDAFAVESRHLGLVTAGEIADVRERVGRIADAVEENVDIDRIVAIAGTAPDLACDPFRTDAVEACGERAPVVAVARDAAFSFYYEENLEMLTDLGLELAFFSPISDTALPAGASALYIGGGYPELHAAALEANDAMRDAVADAIGAGMPTIAECGGFMYLQRELVDADGAHRKMVGALDGRCKNTGRLTHFGYAELHPREDSLLFRAGEPVRAHEFHYWHSDNEGSAARAQKPSGGASWDCLFATGALAAGFPHIYFPSAPQTARRFAEAACAFAKAHDRKGD